LRHTLSAPPLRLRPYRVSGTINFLRLVKWLVKVRCALRIQTARPLSPGQRGEVLNLA